MFEGMKTIIKFLGESYMQRKWARITNYFYEHILGFMKHQDIDYAIANLVKRKVLCEREINGEFYYSIVILPREVSG